MCGCLYLNETLIQKVCRWETLVHSKGSSFDVLEPNATIFVVFSILIDNAIGNLLNIGNFHNRAIH